MRRVLTDEEIAFSPKENGHLAETTTTAEDQLDLRSNFPVGSASLL